MDYWGGGGGGGGKGYVGPPSQIIGGPAHPPAPPPPLPTPMIAKGQSYLHADSDGSDDTGRMAVLSYSVDTDKTAPFKENLIRVCSVCYLVKQFLRQAVQKKI